MTVLFETHKPSLPFVTKKIDFALEPYSDDLIDDMLPLWKSHYDEITFYRDIPLSPDLNTYRQSDKLGMLKIFTARHNGKLVGYEVFFVHTHPHYSSALEAVQDSLFLDPEIRSGLIGYRFMKWNDDELKMTGAKVIFRFVSNRKDYAVLLDRLGYIKHDEVYSRRIK